MTRLILFLFSILISQSGILSAQDNRPSNYVEVKGVNDILFFPAPTDRYFSHGTSVSFFSERFGNSNLASFHPFPQDRILGISIEQNLFTPTDVSSLDPKNYDRPFASYFMVSMKGASVLGRSRINSSIGLGIMGPPSGGNFVQNLVHSMTPHSDSVLGWENQIQPELLLQYSILGELLLNESHFHTISGYGGMGLGTLQDELSLGIALRVGMLEGPFLATILPSSKKWAAWIEWRNDLHFMAYDATLQGSLFRQDPNAVKKGQLNLLRMRSELTLHLRWKQFSLIGGWRYITKETRDMEDHTVGSLGIRYYW